MVWGMVVMGTTFESDEHDEHWIIIRPSAKRTEADTHADPGSTCLGR